MSTILKFPEGESSFKNINSSSGSQGPILIAMGGGKGGVGKSFVSVNMAISLARHASVCLIDLDLGGANAHTYLGATPSGANLGDYLSHRITKFSDLSSETQVRSLSLISAANDNLDIANMNEFQVQKILEGARSLNVSYVIFDLGAGTAQHTLDFFLAANYPILTVTPEPTSVENTYRFLKAAFYRKMQGFDMGLELNQMINSAMDQKNQFGIKTPADLIKLVATKNPAAAQKLSDYMSTLQFHFILNQVRTAQDLQIGIGMTSVSKKYFGLETFFLGHIQHDDAVWQLLRRKTPVLIGQPYSSTSNQISAIAKKLLAPSLEKAVI